jgi:glutamate N-acetyltransferase/amino-acid N-acetyltransferase
MIRPDMATMLAYVATDADIETPALRRLLRDAVAESFNRITVDGDTSTNDACVLMATGQSGLSLAAASDHERFEQALRAVCTELAREIVADGEGATREAEIRVTGAASVGEAERVAFAVAESPLVKTALFAGDPNWGRILAAVGRAGVVDLDVGRVTIRIDDCPIVEAGGLSPRYDEALAAARMAADHVPIVIDLDRGGQAASVWTCDFSYDYVRINAEYRS